MKNGEREREREREREKVTEFIMHRFLSDILAEGRKMNRLFLMSIDSRDDHLRVKQRL